MSNHTSQAILFAATFAAAFGIARTADAQNRISPDALKRFGVQIEKSSNENNSNNSNRNRENFNSRIPTKPVTTNRPAIETKPTSTKPIDAGTPKVELTPRIPVKTTPVKPAPKPDPVDSKKMIAVLKGQNTNKIATTDISKRKTTIDPKALPKGYETLRIKKGNAHAHGDDLADAATETKTLYMKKGNDHAEGEEHGHDHDVKVIRIKDGRPAAGGEYLAGSHGHHGHDSHDDHGLSHSGGSSYGNVSFPADPPAELSYQVDKSSMLATDAVHFRKGSTDLADEFSYRYLVELSKALNSSDLAGEAFVIEGHASADGSANANLVLSQQRANAIFDFLVSRGISADRLLAVGHGESQARFGAHEPEYLLAQDRQVVVFRLAN